MTGNVVQTEREASNRRPALLAVSVATVGVLPAFLTGGRAARLPRSCQPAPVAGRARDYTLVGTYPRPPSSAFVVQDDQPIHGRRLDDLSSTFAFGHVVDELQCEKTALQYVSPVAEQKPRVLGITEARDDFVQPCVAFRTSEEPLVQAESLRQILKQVIALERSDSLLPTLSSRSKVQASSRSRDPPTSAR